MAAPGNKRRIPMTVTFLGMNSKPSVVPPPQPRGKVALLRCEKPPIHFYRYLYDTIGADYYWVDRKKLSPEGLAEVIHDPQNQMLFCTRMEIPPAWRSWISAKRAAATSPISD